MLKEQNEGLVKISKHLDQVNIKETLNYSYPINEGQEGKDTIQNVMQAENIYKHLMMGDLKTELNSTQSQISQLTYQKETNKDNISYYKSENRRLNS